MATPAAAKPDRVTGLPPGVSVAPLGRRLVAQLVDAAVPLVLGLVLLQVQDDGAGASAATVIGVLLIAAWSLLVWWMFATRAAGPGMRLMKLQLVGFTNGRPIGWGRFLVRTLVLLLLTASVVGLLLMLVVLLRHPRHQGWHDRAANGVVIVQRQLAPRLARPPRPAPARQVTPVPRDRPSAVGARSGTAAAGADAPAVAVRADTARPAAVAVGAPGVADRPSGPATDPGATRTRPKVQQRAVDSRWVVVLDDGRQIKVQGLVVLGRKPEARPGEEGAQLIKLADETRTVSKSHLALEVDQDGLVVTDRGSTNGSRVTSPEGETRRCIPWEAVRLQPGAVVSMGDHWLRVQQS